MKRKFSLRRVRSKSMFKEKRRSETVETDSGPVSSAVRLEMLPLEGDSSDNEVSDVVLYSC